MITDIIDLLQKDNFYGAGKYTEIAKGKYQMVTSWVIFKEKINRLWQSRKSLT